MYDPESTKEKKFFPYPKPNKYKAQKTIIDGMEFPSRLEAETYAYLKFREKVGILKNLQRYASVKLTLAGISYKPDFMYEDMAGNLVYAEAKGKDMERWRMIKKLWRYYGPAKLEVYKASRRGVFLDQIIQPDLKNITLPNY